MSSSHKVVSALRGCLPEERIRTAPSELFVYEADGFTIARSQPLAVVFPVGVDEVVRVVRVLGAHGVQIVPRGSGTGLAGGCVAFDNGVIVSTVRMNRILSIDIASRFAHVEAGVLNLDLSNAVAHLTGGAGYHFSPDPSSQRASTIGGNAATNAGGIHVLKDFVTSNHVLGLEMVLPNGKVARFGATGGACEPTGGFDLPGLICGSEGTFGIITQLWVRLVPKPTSFRTLVGLFDSQANACDAVSDIIAEGLLPSALEMLDGRMVQVIEDTYHFGFRKGTSALVLCEIDGIDVLLDAQMNCVERIMRDRSATDVQTSSAPERRARLWKARKSAFGAIGRISPSYCTQDACVPRSALRQVLARIDEIGRSYGLSINNVFHAGDGNVHPIFLYDDRDPAQTQNVMRAAADVLRYCVDVGGTITGEHGVGVEKIHLMPYQFDAATMRQFDRVKLAFDPAERINAGKLVPSATLCVDLLRPGRHVPQ